MIWDNLDDLERKEKIDAICEDLLKKLDKIADWKKDGGGVRHRDYNLEVYEHVIIRPKRVKIPRKWRKKMRQKIKKIYHHHQMDVLGFLHDIIVDRYPLHAWIGSEEQREWIKENAKEDDYVIIDRWCYFKNESIAVAYKLRWM